jgi:hypothetical protein
MSISSSGFALRTNGSCQTNEVDCGATVAPYRACCPSVSFCPSQYNVDAGQTFSLQDMDADSAPSAVQPPQTAQVLCCRIRNAQIKLGICMITVATSAVRRASLGMLLLPTVMDVHRQVMRFEVARYCWTL